jgi:homogentisate 1,2-dioxygenase
LHNAMSAHGPDAQTFNKASQVNLKPQKIENTMAFMFESSLIYHPTRFAVECGLLQNDYISCWRDLESKFKPPVSKSK